VVTLGQHLLDDGTMVMMSGETDEQITDERPTPD
jgi:hypothetical protein